jgi:ribosomal 30S subunit maturation factor RimM
MSEFSSAVTAVEMAMKAFGMDGEIPIKMDSEAQTIQLDNVLLVANGANWRAVTVATAEAPDGGEEIAVTTDVVEAVVEATAFLVAQQAKTFLYGIFEDVDDEVELDA